MKLQQRRSRPSMIGIPETYDESNNMFRVLHDKGERKRKQMSQEEKTIPLIILPIISSISNNRKHSINNDTTRSAIIEECHDLKGGT